MKFNAQSSDDVKDVNEAFDRLPPAFIDRFNLVWKFHSKYKYIFAPAIVHVHKMDQRFVVWKSIRERKLKTAIDNLRKEYRKGQHDNSIPVEDAIDLLIQHEGHEISIKETEVNDLITLIVRFMEMIVYYETLLTHARCEYEQLSKELNDVQQRNQRGV